MQQVITVDVYFKATEQDQHSASRVLTLILQSLVQAMPDKIKFIESFQKRIPNSTPEPEQVAEIILRVLEGTKLVCVFLDGLDECHQGSLPTILKNLKRIQEKSQIGLVLTERSETGRWRRVFAAELLHSLEANKDDMRAYLEHRFTQLVEEDSNVYAWIKQDQLLYAKAVDRLLESSGRM